VTLDEILEGYPKIENVSELLDSDILVFPLHKDGAFGQKQLFEIKNDKLKLKYYCDGKPTFSFQASVDTIINLAMLIVNSITGLVIIADSIQKNHKSDTVNITINVPTVNNFYIGDTYEGSGSDVSGEILDLKEHFR